MVFFVFVFAFMCSNIGQCDMRYLHRWTPRDHGNERARTNYILNFTKSCLHSVIHASLQTHKKKMNSNLLLFSFFFFWHDVLLVFFYKKTFCFFSCFRYFVEFYSLYNCERNDHKRKTTQSNYVIWESLRRKEYKKKKKKKKCVSTMTTQWLLLFFFLRFIYY